MVNEKWNVLAKNIPLESRIKVAIYSNLVVEYGKSFVFLNDSDGKLILDRDEINKRCGELTQTLFNDCVRVIDQWKEDGKPE